MFFKIILILIIASLLTNEINCANSGKNNAKRNYNILGIFHFPSQSHHILGSTLLKELTRRGHNVTMISPFPFKEKIPNYTDIKIEGLKEFKEEFMQEFSNNQKFSPFSSIHVMLSTIPRLGNIIYEQEAIQNLIKSDSKFDVIIVFHPSGEMFFPLSHRFNAPIILFSALGGNNFLNKLTGNIGPYSYVPNPLSPFTENMTFYERVVNTLMGLGMEIITDFVLHPQYKALSKTHFPEAPPFEELCNNVALALVNSHFSTESPRPYVPNTIQIGGFHVEAAELLPNDLKKFLDEAKDGVIYFSFGTNIHMSVLAQDKMNIVIRSLSKIKQKVLWKFDGNIEGLSKNIRIEKWLPQKSILVHHNVKAFITHGGRGSILESIKAAVPMLIMPFFADQLKNAADATNGKYAISLLFNEITEESFSNALNDIVNNPIYKKNMKLKSSLLNNQPMKPMDTAMYWIDHVIQHGGGDHLKPASLKLNLFQELCLDVYAFLIGAFILIILAIYLLIRGICKLCTRCKGSRKDVKDKVKVS